MFHARKWGWKRIAANLLLVPVLTGVSAAGAHAQFNPVPPQAGSAKLPALAEDITDARAKLDERATQIRSMIETLDLLYDAFGQRRLSKDWSDTLPKMQKWLTREERRAA